MGVLAQKNLKIKFSQVRNLEGKFLLSYGNRFLYDRNLEEFVETYDRKFFIDNTFRKETWDRKSLYT